MYFAPRVTSQQMKEERNSNQDAMPALNGTIHRSRRSQSGRSINHTVQMPLISHLQIYSTEYPKCKKHAGPATTGAELITPFDVTPVSSTKITPRTSLLSELPQSNCRSRRNAVY